MTPPLPDSDRSRRIYPLLQNQDLENVSQATLKSVGDPISIENLNEDELRKLVLVNLARLSVKGEWNGLLTAASGGDFNAVVADADLMNSPYNLNRIDCTPPWGMNTGNSGNPSDDEPRFFPFIAPKTGTVDGIVIDIDSAAGSPCNAVLAIYSDEGGLPKTKLGTDATFDATSTGQVEQTSVGTISLTKGSQYWIGYTRSASVSFNFTGGASSYPWSGPTENISSGWTILWLPSGSDNVLPSTITQSDLDPRGYYKISVGLNI